MSLVAGIRFQSCGKIYDFDSTGVEVKKGDSVIVESDLGLSIGKVVELREEEGPPPEKPLKPILRKATDEDITLEKNNDVLRGEARAFCIERIMARGLPMKLVCTDATLDKRRIIFYFVANMRIDFRELVKDLAAKFRTRIELRQIGVRDEAKLIGGLGICGREVCCRKFLSSFEPISIKMAKKQELVLNTTKLTGTCGRLMCCLNFETVAGGRPARDYRREEPVETVSDERAVLQEPAVQEEQSSPEVTGTSRQASPEPPAPQNPPQNAPNQQGQNQQGKRPDDGRHGKRRRWRGHKKK